MSKNYVRADYDKLPIGWQNDPEYREGVYRTIRGMIREGRFKTDIARAVGCSDRTVQRVANRLTEWGGRQITTRCGVDRVIRVYNHLLRTYTTVSLGLPCSVAVKKEGDRCPHHR